MSCTSKSQNFCWRAIYISLCHFSLIFGEAADFTLKRSEQNYWRKTILCLFVLVAIAVTARMKRANRGTYSPSRQELQGSRIDFESTLKVPPEERLIWDTPTPGYVIASTLRANSCWVSLIYVIVWCISTIVCFYTSSDDVVNAFVCICCSEITVYVRLILHAMLFCIGFYAAYLATMLMLYNFYTVSQKSALLVL